VAKTFAVDEPVEARFRFGGAGRYQHTGPWEAAIYVGAAQRPRRGWHRVRDRFGEPHDVPPARIREVDGATWVPGSTRSSPPAGAAQSRAAASPAAQSRAAEWVEVDGFAVQTASITVAALVAAALNRRSLRSRQRGIVRIQQGRDVVGVAWMCLARFRAYRREDRHG
jgi:hypothetical protein